MKGNRARGVDGWTLGKILRWPERAIAGLVNVIQAVEEPCALPDLRQRRGLAGQAKWSWRKAYHTHWMLVRNLHGCQCDAVQGNCALQSGLLRRIYKEVATLKGQPMVRLFLDLQIFYDSVFAQTHRTGTRAQFLQAAAVHSHASVPQRAYRPCRRIGGAKHAARILAGCSLRSRFARVVLCNIPESQRVPKRAGQSREVLHKEESSTLEDEG